MANEKRLIDANPLIEKFRAHRDLFVSAWNETWETPPKDKARVDELGMCIAETINAPTVDAVEVVRCGECEYFCEPFCIRRDDETHRERINMLTVDFCSYGKRRQSP